MEPESQKVTTFLSEYEPRWYQKEFEEAMFGGLKRAFLLYHRRAGKDFSCWMFMLYCAVVDSPGLYWYILPTYRQGKRVIWDNKDESGKRLIDYIPKELLEGKPNSTDMKINIRNQHGGFSTIQVVGSEDPDSLRGPNPKGVVFSEYADQDPRIWTDVISQILSKNKGWAVFNTTPKGRNHCYDLWNAAQDSPYWFTQKLTIDDTKLVSMEDILKDHPNGISEETLQQEYYVSFDRGIDGTYYGRLITKARQEDRVGRVSYEPRSVVNTAWDLGYRDSTSIVFWQQIGAEVHVIDYYENSGEKLEHYAKLVQSKNYNYGTHYFPHDAGSTSLQTGITTFQIMHQLGIKGVLLKREEDIYPGIELARGMLSNCYIDDINCKHLLKCLEHYHKKFNDKMNCYSDTPVHDWSSHGADAFRYAAIGRNEDRGTNTVSPEQTKEWRLKHLGY